mmetsp:Transcript_36475/g.105065  ORF Transcript_36475/g.105065 Transcript_36475/m.105065 type:complete len:376 (-) Transcript_36475:313-1440(-)
MVFDRVFHVDRHDQAELTPLLLRQVALVTILKLYEELLARGELGLHAEDQEVEVYVQVPDRDNSVELVHVIGLEEQLQVVGHGIATLQHLLCQPPLRVQEHVLLEEQERGLRVPDLADLRRVPLAVAEVVVPGRGRLLLVRVSPGGLHPQALESRILLEDRRLLVFQGFGVQLLLLPLLIDVLVEELEGAVNATAVQLEGRDAGHDQGVPLHEELLQLPPASGLLGPELNDGVGKLLDLVVDDPDLCEGYAPADVLGQARELVEGQEELLEPGQLELPRELLQSIVGEVEFLEASTGEDAIRNGLDVVVGEVDLPYVPLGRDAKVWRQGSQSVVRHVDHLQEVEAARGEDACVDLRDVVVVDDQLLQSRAPRKVL